MLLKNALFAPALLLALTWTQHVAAQNLVKNPSFEEVQEDSVAANHCVFFSFEDSTGIYSPFPYMIKGWYNWATPDRLSKGEMRLRSHMAPRTGKYMVGMHFRDLREKATEEYIYQDIATRAKQSLKVRLYAYTLETMRPSLGSIECYFTNTDPCAYGVRNLEGVICTLYPVERNAQGWNAYEGQIPLENDFQYFVIGNFQVNQGQKKGAKRPKNLRHVYVLVDDISIVDMTPATEKQGAREQPAAPTSDIIPPPTPVVTSTFSTTYTMMFAHDVASLSTDQQQMLDEWLSTFEERVCTITIAGHTDRVGEDAYNQQLSKKGQRPYTSIW